MGVVTMVNKTTLFVMLVDHATRFQEYQASFSPNSTDWLRLQLTQVPRYPDLTIFVSTITMTTTTKKMIAFTPCTCTQGNYYT